MDYAGRKANVAAAESALWDEELAAHTPDVAVAEASVERQRQAVVDQLAKTYRTIGPLLGKVEEAVAGAEPGAVLRSEAAVGSGPGTVFRSGAVAAVGLGARVGKWAHERDSVLE